MVLPNINAPRVPRKNSKDTHLNPKPSGPIEGQMVMHPTDLGRESIGITSTEWRARSQQFDSTQKRHQSADDHGFFQQTATNSRSEPEHDAKTAELFGSHGSDFWDKQPLHSVRSDTPVHSTQQSMDTRNTGRLGPIAEDLSGGGSVKKPVWLVKDRGRLFALDGHHRIAASRQSGKPNFPARVWDRDADTAQSAK